jgi:hypothetical protein
MRSRRRDVAWDYETRIRNPRYIQDVRSDLQGMVNDLQWSLNEIDRELAQLDRMATRPKRKSRVERDIYFPFGKGGGNLPPPFGYLRVTAAHILDVSLRINRAGQRGDHIREYKPPLSIVDDAPHFPTLEQGDTGFWFLA